MIKNNKNGITLIALVITILIMLLLAAIAIQLTLGENGLIYKSMKSNKEHIKSELLETAKIEYANLKSKDLENNTQEASLDKILSCPNFLNNYNIINENITTKNSNEIIMSKKELKNNLNIKSSNYELTEEDKYSAILKLIVPNGSEEERTLGIVISSDSHYPIAFDLDFGNGHKITHTPFNSYKTYKQIYNPGEYIVKIKFTSNTRRS